jgi:hypothetical protein
LAKLLVAAIARSAMKLVRDETVVVGRCVAVVNSRKQEVGLAVTAGG